MNRIALLIPYFGKWPPYLNIFLSSLEKNNTVIDVHFFTDLDLQKYSIPSNLYVHNIGFMEVKNLFEKKIGCKIGLSNSYKLCDLKPTYGLVFSEYISTYDYWGFGDIDLIYGQLDNYINDSILTNYDIFIGREKWISGAFTLLRNTEQINKLFKKSKDYARIFAVPEYMGFDETSKCWSQIRETPINQIDFPFQNFTQIIFSEYQNKRIKLNHSDVIKESIVKDGFVQFSNGQLIDNANKAYMIYHFITEKGKWFFNYPTWDTIPSTYYITTTGFYTLSQYESSFFHLVTYFRRLILLPCYFKRKMKGALRRLGSYLLSLKG